MAWGQRSQGIDDLIQRLQANDPKLKSITLMRQRKLDGSKDVARLCTALASNPHLTELSISAHALDVASAKHLAGLLASPGTCLATINLGDSSFGDDAMAALCQGVAASTSITTMDAEYKGLGSAGGLALAHALSGCPSLTTLSLGRNALGDAGIINLCSSPWAGLRHLDLHDVGMGVGGMEALAGCPGMAQLVSLSCAYNPQLGPDAGPHLQRLVVAAKQLTSLKLQHTGLGVAGGQAIAAALHQLQEEAGTGAAPLHLTELDLAHTGLGDLGGAALASCLLLPSCPFTTLSLEGNRDITDITINHLHTAVSQPPANVEHQEPASPRQKGLTSLNLSATGVTPACLEPLSHLPGLQHLALLGCYLGTPGIEALVGVTKAGGFAALRDLVVSACGLDEAGVHTLLGVLEEGALPGLVSIEMGGNVGCQGEGVHERVEALRAARPGLAVHWRAGDGAPAGPGGGDNQ